MDRPLRKGAASPFMAELRPRWETPHGLRGSCCHRAGPANRGMGADMANSGKTGKTTRAAAAVDKMLSGSQQRKVSVTLTGRAAEQWSDLAVKAQTIGLGDDGLAGMLLHMAFVPLSTELDRRSSVATGRDTGSDTGNKA